MTGRFAFAGLLLILGVTSARPQSPSPRTNNEPAEKAIDNRTGPITGRVVDESGQPMANAVVNVFAAGKQQPDRRTTQADQAGRFQVDDLPRGIYSVTAQVRGYTFWREPGEQAYFRPGASVTLRVRKGGVITGTVTRATGEPVVAVRVNAVRVRDLEGRPITAFAGGTPRYTDDRGVYRLFALAPGVYLVSAGGKVPGYSFPTAFDDDLPVYYPSSTRDTAAQVVVHSGDESTGIDIRYRSEQGHSITGVITNIGSERSGANVWLTRPGGDAVEAQSFSQPRGDEYAFGFHGISDGEYFVNARRAPYQNDDGAGSKPVRVRVKGQDVTGVEVALVPFGSVAGRIILEPLTAKEKKCESKLPLSVEELLITARRDEEDQARGPVLSVFGSSLAAPNEKGEFAIRGLEAGNFHLEPIALDQAWYVRSITLPASARATRTLDAGRNGFAVKPGEHKTGLAVVLSEGAASLEGRVEPEKDALLPGRLRVHLVPAEPQAAEDLMRFAETETGSDGTFKLSNLAPGRYWFVVRQVDEAETSQSSRQRAAWNATTRASLRRGAEALNIVVELKQCQRVVDHVLRYKR
ncbi:MAG TPA: carboxypeptidase-like regulatory domain-containing protein [Blastocatellia bacterium]|nr:carboxypeptidase-like regulatory domain-containing protein [Blastocatellia bacterium]